MREEFAQWSDRFRGVNPRAMEKEEAQYETPDLITVPSEFAFRSFLDPRIPAYKLRKVLYGVDLKILSMVAKPEADRFQVLFVGQVSFRKSVPYLLGASALSISRETPEDHRRLQTEMKRHLARQLPGPEVKFTGPLLRVQLKEVISRSHVMVLPSVEEGLAYVQAAAMA